jgi:hypothetical protein
MGITGVVGLGSFDLLPGAAAVLFAAVSWGGEGGEGGVVVVVRGRPAKARGALSFDMRDSKVL